MISNTSYILPHNEAGKKILKSFPHTKTLFNITGTIDEYYTETASRSFTPLADKRAGFFFESIQFHCKDLFTEDDIKHCLDSIKTSPVISSAEHVCCITHPEICNTIIAQAIFRSHKKQSFIISFASASLKLCNELDSRFLYLKNGIKVPLVPSAHQNKIILHSPAINGDDVKNKIIHTLNEHLSKKDIQIIMDWLDPVFVKISTLDRFWKQICYFNYQYWKNISQLSAIELPATLIMLPIESLVTQALIFSIKNNDSSWITNILFDKKIRNVLHKGLNGIRSCWDSENDKGTFLFWGIDHKSRPLRLYLEGEFLVSRDSTIKVLLKPEELCAALESHKIVPAINICFLYCVFYLGINLFGGIFQIQYLPEMLSGLLKIKEKMGFQQSDYDILQSCTTDLYVNFETRAVSDKGLTRLINPFCKKEWTGHLQSLFQDEIQGCLRFLTDYLN